MSTSDKQQCLASVETHCALLQLLYSHISWCAQSSDPIPVLSPHISLYTVALFYMFFNQRCSTIVFLNLLKRSKKYCCYYNLLVTEILSFINLRQPLNKKKMHLRERSWSCNLETFHRFLDKLMANGVFVTLMCHPVSKPAYAKLLFLVHFKATTRSFHLRWLWCPLWTNVVWAPPPPVLKTLIWPAGTFYMEAGDRKGLLSLTIAGRMAMSKINNCHLKCGENK